MRHAALGLRVHSGWAALAAVGGAPHSFEVIERRTISVIDPAMAGAKQPYHHAEHMELRAAEEHLAKCTGVAERMAFTSLGDVIRDLADRDYRVAGAAIVLAAGRPLPGLARILASHALIHTAEGEFFRAAFSSACERLGIRAMGIRGRDLTEPLPLERPPGPPWTQDQKLAAAAACQVLLRGAGPGA